MSLDVVAVGLVCADVMVRPVEAFPERGKIEVVPTIELHMGGLAGVAATVLCQLGAQAAFIGCVGQDSFGDYLWGRLRAAGVETGGLRRVAAHGSAATIVLIGQDGERTFLHHPGANKETSEDDIDLDLVSRSRVLHWGGPSVTPRLDGAPMGRVFERVRALGVKTSLDTCYDGSGTWLPLLEPALHHVDVIFSSLEEARRYTGRREPEEIADFYRAYGADIAVIKLGGEGLYVQSSSEAFGIPAHRVPIVDTTGAGDASCAGFLYGYTRGWPLERCARLANAVGGLTVQHVGGAEAVTSLDDALNLMEGGT